MHIFTYIGSRLTCSLAFLAGNKVMAHETIQWKQCIRGQGTNSVSWKNWNSAQILLSSTLDIYPKYFFDAEKSTEKSTSEIDADLAQNEMLLYLIPSHQLNLSYANEYICQRGDIVKWHTNCTCIIFHPHCRKTMILSNFFYKIHGEKCSFFTFSAPRVKRGIWNQHILVNVYVA